MPDSKLQDVGSVHSWRWKVFLFSSHALFFILTHQIVLLLKQDNENPVGNYPKSVCRWNGTTHCSWVTTAGSPGQLDVGQLTAGECQRWGEPPCPPPAPSLSPSFYNLAYPSPPIPLELCGRNSYAWRSVWLSPKWSVFLVREKPLFSLPLSSSPIFSLVWITAVEEGEEKEVPLASSILPLHYICN